jgi:hypothetical protein
MWRFNSAEGEDEPRVFIGLELEYDNDTDDDELESHAKYLDQNYGLSITQDGSVSGFEVKTHPSSLAYYQQDQKWGWLEYLRDNDFEGWDATNAGIHANINPEAFDNASHLYKFIAFIYTNITDVGIFAGRLNPHYSSFTDRRLLTNKSLSYFKSRLGYWERGERGSAVNTTNNGRIEVRLFRSSMNRDRILAIVEFVHALIEYTRHLPTEHIRRNRDQVFKFSSLVRFASEQTDHEYLNFCENFHTWNEDGTWHNAEDDLLRYFKNSRNHWSNERMYPHYDSLEKFDAMAFTRDSEFLGMPEVFFTALNQEGM